MSHASASPLAKTLDAIRRGVAENLHIGAQVVVSRGGTNIADLALGESRPGVAMKTGTLVPWMSCSKPVTAVAIAQLWERGRLELDDPVARHIPEFAAGGKRAVTVRHLLTHTGGFRAPTMDFSEMSWEQIIAAICQIPLERDWVPGHRAGYHTRTSWYILGEIVRRIDGRPVENYVRQEIFEPLGMTNCWLALPPAKFDEYGDRIGVLARTSKGRVAMDNSRELRDAAARCAPGASGRGPMRELSRFYQMLLSHGELEGARIISSQTVEAITARQRTRMYDQTFRSVCDWGLGFKLDAKLHGKTFEPYGYGEHASHRTFGHGGAESSVSFADPEHQLVVCMFLNGAPGDRAHQKRMHEILTLLYDDLSLAPTAAA